MLLRDSRVSSGLTKESKSLVTAGPGLLQRAMTAVSEHGGVGKAFKEWKPTSLIGKAIKHPLPAIGIGLGAGTIASSGAGVAKSLVPKVPGPAAMEARRLAGFK